MNFLEMVKKVDMGYKCELQEEMIVVFKNENWHYMAREFPDGYSKYTPTFKQMLSEEWEIVIED